MVQLQENLALFEDLDADLYAISADTPSNSMALKEAGEFTYSFLSDESLSVLDYVHMKDEEHQMSYRGVSILDENGEYLFHHINDHWGEQIEETAQLIYDQLNE
ncbi:redoxin domain-containing protein [Halalkalibacter oceani]|uniref:redoxin domain-containing protein n=1 Tax=Halalkalibacter oceani TaxID=1653776 RepID=UPI002559B4F9|nr:redoxin domain-containing protein [Halalkalibacter oceani]